jgi:hypothetical protein
MPDTGMRRRPDDLDAAGCEIDHKPVSYVTKPRQVQTSVVKKSADVDWTSADAGRRANLTMRLARRGFIDRIVIPPSEGLLQVVGNFGKMLEAAA